MTGTRPAVCSTTMSTTLRRSSEDMVPTSPVEPQATTPPTPAETERSTTALRRSASMLSLESKGVARAVRTPDKCLDIILLEK